MIGQQQLFRDDPYRLGWPRQIYGRTCLRPSWRRPMDVWALADRRSLWPDGVPTFRTVSFVSSRWRGGPHAQRPIFAELRRLCMDVRRWSNFGVLVVRGTTLARYLPSLLEELELPWIDLQLPPTGQSLANWNAKSLRFDPVSEPPSVAGGCYRCFLSPPAGSTRVEWGESEPPPLRDLLSVICADRVLVFQLRARGNLAKSLQWRLAGGGPAASNMNFRPPRQTEPSPEGMPRSVCEAGIWIAVSEDHFVTPRQATPWLTQGCRAWRPVPAPFDSTANSPARELEQGSFWLLSREKLTSTAPEWSYLTHWTRAQPDRWPDQEEVDFVRELRQDSWRLPRTAFTTLLRILGMGRILGNGAPFRGGKPMVSFTAATPLQVRELHTFRPHRHRWDFEPYGIGILKSQLQLLGARPVIYGDETEWSNLDVQARPYFQKQYASQGKVNWCLEQEWRFPGDVRLDQCPVESVIVFVPSRSEAQQVASACGWPVAVFDFS